MRSEFLDNSICRDCKHLVIRVIQERNLSKLLDELGVVLDEEDYADDGTDVIFDSYMCKELDTELDHYVLECSSYSGKMVDKI